MGVVGQVVGYARVSSADQNPARQYEALGDDVSRVFEDRISGKSRAPRVELARMIAYIRDGDVARVASMDRLARSLPDLLEIVREINAKGAAVEFVKEGLTFKPNASDPYSTFQLHVLGAVAELERELIRERQREGIAIAKSKGKYRGRRAALTAEQVDQARSLIEQGVPKAKVARSLGVSRATLYTALAEAGTYAGEQAA